MAPIVMKPAKAIISVNLSIRPSPPSPNWREHVNNSGVFVWLHSVMQQKASNLFANAQST